ncbi:hypothetical protein OHV52_00130 [Acinetobacter baumannii]|uniref:hypothetical protein n=1 Tax=Acinetobacter baumannii TaxID=470 RepID=UPI000423F0AF|nr:hypothetical protein [Acinetobacter baumannii]EHU2105390.1 hypothetical protein [Acinetobacter baumannii]MDC4298703.1 hypothetical protein [Acinetobacter baumannii]MDC4302498.1 hypothetical protein [Acinetobacter baumannii]MDC4330333.1 hypothetical protein [Acinetobacter baumannii]MDC4514362.1 hypothetical protein [Acinetobacter baumannii]
MEDDYQHITFNVTITSDVSDKYYIVMFSGDDLIFPIILEFPKNEYRLKAGWIDIFYISKEVVRKGKKRIKFLKLIDEYIRANHLLDFDG